MNQNIVGGTQYSTGHSQRKADVEACVKILPELEEDAACGDIAG